MDQVEELIYDHEDTPSSEDTSKDEPKDAVVAVAGKEDAKPALPEMLVLMSGDRVEFRVPLELVQRSPSTLARITELRGEEEGDIVLPSISGDALWNVITLWSKKGDSSSITKFLDNVAPCLLFDIVRACFFLNSMDTLDVTADFIARKIENMTVEECRDYLGIMNDFTSDEEESVRSQHPWAYSFHTV